MLGCFRLLVGDTDRESVKETGRRRGDRENDQGVNFWRREGFLAVEKPCGENRLPFS